MGARGDRVGASEGDAREFDWRFLFVAGMHFQDLFNYDFRRTEMCIIPYGTQLGEISFCAYNTGVGWRQVVEKMYRTASVAEWSRKHGKHPVYAKNQILPIIKGPLSVKEHELALAERQADPEIRVVGHLMLGTGLSFAGRIPDGLPELEAGVRFFEEHDYDASRFSLGPDPRVSTWTALSLLQWWQGRLDTSTQRSDAALAMARRLDHPSTTGYALYHAALLRLWRNEPAEARELAVRVIEVADEYELHIWKAVGTVIVGASAVALGTGDEGLRWVSEGLERYRGLRTPPIFWPFLLLVRAEACARAGRDTEGLASADEALALAPFLPDLHVVRGDLLHAAGAMDEATASWERALETAHGWGAATPELRAALRLCALQPATDPLRRDAWLGALRDVRATFSEGLDAPEIAQADTLLGSSD